MKQKVNIAVCGPLTGPRSAYGNMLVSECERLHQVNVRLKHFDDWADPEQALRVADTVIDEQFDVVIGHLNSYCSLAVKDHYFDAHIGFISPLSTNPNLTFEQGGALFCPSDDDQLKALQQVAKRDNKQIYALHDNSHYSENLISHLGLQFPKKRTFDNAEKFPAEMANNSIVFLAGAHCNLTKPHKTLREAYPELIIVCCDDCYIEEYFDNLAPEINLKDFVIGQRKGHLGNLRQSVGYLHDLVNLVPDDIRLFDFIGKNFGNYTFKTNGRLANATWQLLPITSLIRQ
jgi:hypothetical protein